MPDPDGPPRPPADNALYRREDWAVVRKKTVAAAYRFVSSLPKASDLVQTAVLTCITDPKEPWLLPQRPLVLYLVRVLSRVAFNVRAHRERFPSVQAAEDTPHEDGEDAFDAPFDAILRSQEKNPEQAYISAEQEAIFARRLLALAAKTKDDAPVTFIIDAIKRGEESPKDVALAAGYDIDDIYKARKRLERAARVVLEDEKKAERTR
jgi:DNA-directed RNA polymerase specialized sigma24 family protein